MANRSSSRKGRQTTTTTPVDSIQDQTLATANELEDSSAAATADNQAVPNSSHTTTNASVFPSGDGQDLAEDAPADSPAKRANSRALT